MQFPRSLTFEIPDLGDINIAAIMCPDGKRPGFVADEVGVEGANGKVVDPFVLAARYKRMSGRRTLTTLGFHGILNIGDDIIRVVTRTRGLSLQNNIFVSRTVDPRLGRSVTKHHNTFENITV